jgi:GT2 family glycosyltransferase
VKGTFSFGAGLAREAGVRNATGSRILFIDPDQRIESHCTQEHWDWGNRGFSVVIGDRISSALDLESPWNQLRTVALNRQEHWWLSFFTGNSSVSRELLEKVGGFDSTLQYWGLDDTDLAFRLYMAGASIWHTPRAQVYHIDGSSGGGSTYEERLQSFRLHMEVLYRKYLRVDILNAFSFAWPRDFWRST